MHGNVKRFAHMVLDLIAKITVVKEMNEHDPGGWPLDFDKTKLDLMKDFVG